MKRDLPHPQLDTARSNPPGIARSAPVVADLTAFLVEPFEISCSQGQFTSTCMALAIREGRVFFSNLQTKQFGVAMLASQQGEATDAFQFPTLELAKRVFSFAGNFPEEEDHFGIRSPK